MARLYSPGLTIGRTDIASNGLEVELGTLITIESGFAKKADVGDTILGITNASKTYDADNETVKQSVVESHAVQDFTLLEMKVVGGTISGTDRGTTYNINADQDVDASTAGTGDQLKLVQVKTDTLGIFTRNK